MMDARAHDRVREQTPPHVNDRIDVVTDAMARRAAAGGRGAIEVRLEALTREWDVDRTVLASFGIIGMLSSLLGERNRGWKYFFRVQQCFLLWYTFVGWCPPSAVARRMGVRTWQEISAEREALTRLLAEGSGHGQLAAPAGRST